MYLSYCEEQLKAAEKKSLEKTIEQINSSLKSCSCCGGKAKVKESFHIDGYGGHETYIECSQCGLRTKKIIADSCYYETHTLKKAAELWNRRYSGIDDKNGKPIYEGDHIRIIGEGFNDRILGEYEVHYSDFDFSWFLKKVINDADYMSSRIIYFNDLNLRHFTDEIELVYKED